MVGKICEKGRSWAGSERERELWMVRVVRWESKKMWQQHEQKTRRQRTGALYVQHYQMLQHSRLPFSWTMSRNSPELNALVTRFSESYNLYSSVSMSRESKRLKKSSSDWLNSGSALIGLQHLSENAIIVFSRFAGYKCRSTSYLRWHSKASFDALLYR